MADLKTNVTQRAETTITSTLSAGATTINVADSSAFPSVPFYAHLAPEPESTTFEEVLVDSGKTATTFTLTSSTKRGQGGTTDREHPSGTVIAVIPSATVINDLHDRVDAVDAALVTDHGELTGLSDDDHTQYALADGSRGDFEESGAAASAVSDHEGEANPHPAYLTPAEGNDAYEALIDRTGASEGDVATLQGDGTLALGAPEASAPVTVLDRSTATVSVGPSSTTEGDLVNYTIPAGTLVAGDILRLAAFGDLLQDTGDSSSLTFRVRLGSTTVVSGGPASLGKGASRRVWAVALTLVVVSVTSQRLNLRLSGSTAGAGWTTVDTSDFPEGLGSGVATEDLDSGDRDLRLTCQLPVSHASFDVRRHGYLLEKIGA